MIQKANGCVKLLAILRQYNSLPKQKGGDWSEPMTCPFPAHKGGNERSPSFYYNFVQDRFYCQGCSTSGRAVEFISNKEGSHPSFVAERLIKEYYGYEIETSEPEPEEDFLKIEEILFGFSKLIRELILANKNNKIVLGQIETVAAAFDKFLEKRAPKNKLKINELELATAKYEKILKRIGEKA